MIKYIFRKIIMVTFKDDEHLGKAITAINAYSFGVDPIRSFGDIIFASGGNKFSQLCGFRFTARKTDTQFKEFKIVFCSKLRSKIYHDMKTNPSKWFIFVPVDDLRVEVINDKQLMEFFGFDIKKFFDSDMFAKYLPMFEKTCKKGIQMSAEFLDKKAAESKDSTSEINAALFSLKAIKEAIPLIKDKNLNLKSYSLVVN